MVREPTLEEAIREAFRVPSPGEAQAAPVPLPQSEETLDVPANALGMACKLFEQAEDAFKKGEWEKFGQAMEKLGEYLRK